MSRVIGLGPDVVSSSLEASERLISTRGTEPTSDRAAFMSARDGRSIFDQSALVGFKECYCGVADLKLFSDAA